MPTIFTLQDLSQIRRAVGRGVVFIAGQEGSAGFVPGVWNGTSEIVLHHLGDTEGDIKADPKSEIALLTTPELTGPAPREADAVGEAPTIEIPMYLSDPSLRDWLSPTGFRSGGQSVRMPVKEHTLIIIPEMALATTDESGNPTRGALAFDGDEWTLDDDTLPAANADLLQYMFSAWRGYFAKPPMTFRGGAGDAKRDIDTVTFTLMHHNAMPAGHKLYTIGDPAGFGIALGGTS